MEIEIVPGAILAVMNVIQDMDIIQRVEGIERTHVVRVKLTSFLQVTF